MAAVLKKRALAEYSIQVVNVINFKLFFYQCIMYVNILFLLVGTTTTGQKIEMSSKTISTDNWRYPVISKYNN